MTPTSQVHALVEQLGSLLQKQHYLLVTAESCTGGQLAQTITALPKASQWFDRGFVTYSLQSKQEMLDIPAAALKKYGPVSKEIVKAMAQGALTRSTADVSIAITGIAGPDGGTKEIPVGTIYFGWMHKTFCETAVHQFSAERLINRYEAVEFALKRLIHLLQNLNANSG